MKLGVPSSVSRVNWRAQREIPAWNMRAVTRSFRDAASEGELRELRNANNCNVFSVEWPHELCTKRDRIARRIFDAFSGVLPISAFQFCQGNRIRRCLRAVSASRESFMCKISNAQVKG